MSINLANWFYLISIAMQLGGSFLLAYMVFTRTYKDIADMVSIQIPIGKSFNDVELPAVKKLLKETYLTRIGFSMLFTGYLFMFFGDSNIIGINKVIQVIIVGTLVMIFSIQGKIVSEKYATSKEKEVSKYVKDNIPAGTAFCHIVD